MSLLQTQNRNAAIMRQCLLIQSHLIHCTLDQLDPDILDPFNNLDPVHLRNAIKHFVHPQRAEKLAAIQASVPGSSAIAAAATSNLPPEALPLLFPSLDTTQYAPQYDWLMYFLSLFSPTSTQRYQNDVLRYVRDEDFEYYPPIPSQDQVAFCPETTFIQNRLFNSYDEFLLAQLPTVLDQLSQLQQEQEEDEELAEQQKKQDRQPHDAIIQSQNPRTSPTPLNPIASTPASTSPSPIPSSLRPFFPYFPNPHPLLPTIPPQTFPSPQLTMDNDHFVQYFLHMWFLGPLFLTLRPASPPSPSTPQSSLSSQPIDSLPQLEQQQQRQQQQQQQHSLAVLKTLDQFAKLTILSPTVSDNASLAYQFAVYEFRALYLATATPSLAPMSTSEPAPVFGPTPIPSVAPTPCEDSTSKNPLPSTSQPHQLPPSPFSTTISAYPLILMKLALPTYFLASPRAPQLMPSLPAGLATPQHDPSQPPPPPPTSPSPTTLHHFKTQLVAASLLVNHFSFTINLAHTILPPHLYAPTMLDSLAQVDMRDSQHHLPINGVVKFNYHLYKQGHRTLYQHIHHKLLTGTPPLYTFILLFRPFLRYFFWVYSTEQVEHRQQSWSILAQHITMCVDAGFLNPLPQPSSSQHHHDSDPNKSKSSPIHDNDNNDDTTDAVVADPTRTDVQLFSPHIHSRALNPDSPLRYHLPLLFRTYLISFLIQLTGFKVYFPPSTQLLADAIVLLAPNISRFGYLDLHGNMNRDADEYIPRTHSDAESTRFYQPPSPPPSSSLPSNGPNLPHSSKPSHTTGIPDPLPTTPTTTTSSTNSLQLHLQLQPLYEPTKTPTKPTFNFPYGCPLQFHYLPDPLHPTLAPNLKAALVDDVGRLYALKYHDPAQQDDDRDASGDATGASQIHIDSTLSTTAAPSAELAAESECEEDQPSDMPKQRINRTRDRFLNLAPQRTRHRSLFYDIALTDLKLCSRWSMKGYQRHRGRVVSRAALQWIESPANQALLHSQQAYALQKQLSSYYRALGEIEENIVITVMLRVHQKAQQAGLFDHLGDFREHNALPTSEMASPTSQSTHTSSFTTPIAAPMATTTMATTTTTTASTGADMTSSATKSYPFPDPTTIPAFPLPLPRTQANNPDLANRPVSSHALPPPSPEHFRARMEWAIELLIVGCTDINCTPVCATTPIPCAPVPITITASSPSIPPVPTPSTPSNTTTAISNPPREESIDRSDRVKHDLLHRFPPVLTPLQQPIARYSTNDPSTTSNSTQTDQTDPSTGSEDANTSGFGTARAHDLRLNYFYDCIIPIIPLVSLPLYLTLLTLPTTLPPPPPPPLFKQL